VLQDSDWASFSDRLESYHDDVHVWVGGDMVDITTAGYDPVFYAHHCMIDRVWYLWQVKWGIENDTSRQSGQFRWPQSKHLIRRTGHSGRLIIGESGFIFSFIAAIGEF